MNSFNKYLEELVDNRIKEVLDSQAVDLAQVVRETISKPEYTKWGRYLTPKQAMIYTGYRSINGFKEMCRTRGILAIKGNARVVRYDREQIDQVLQPQAIQKYLQTL